MNDSDNNHNTTPRTGSDLTNLVRQAAETLAHHSAATPTQDGTKVVVNDAISDLIDALGKGDVSRIENALSSLGAPQESELYSKVGTLARTLHESLKDFAKSLDKSNLTMSTTNIPDAAAKLEHVIQMTHDAAHKTMNLVDEQLALIHKQRAIIARAREALDSRSLSDSAFRERCTVYLTSLEQSLECTSKVNEEVVLAQEYQDLTGQSLKKVVTLVTDLEKNLLSLIKLFGVQHDAPSKNDTAAKVNQDEADALLSSFGF